MKRLLTWIGTILAWVVILWGCLVVAFGFADFYSVKFGGVVPGELVMGDPVPTLAQSMGEIAVGLGMIVFALLCRRQLGKKRKTRSVSA